MRKKLDELFGKRVACQATYIIPKGDTAGAKRGERGKIMLTNIREKKTGEKLTDHMWVDAYDWRGEIKPGDIFTFTAEVAAYMKHNYKMPHRREIDFKFVNPQNIHVIGNKFHQKGFVLEKDEHQSEGDNNEQLPV